MSVDTIFQKCLANLVLNCESLIEFLISNGKKFHNVWLQKKKESLRLIMLAVFEAIFDAKERFFKIILCLLLLKQYLIQKKYCKGLYYKDGYLHSPL